jgi:hypothetical protein
VRFESGILDARSKGTTDLNPEGAKILVAAIWPIEISFG